MTSSSAPSNKNIANISPKKTVKQTKQTAAVNMLETSIDGASVKSKEPVKVISLAQAKSFKASPRGRPRSASKIGSDTVSSITASFRSGSRRGSATPKSRRSSFSIDSQSGFGTDDEIVEMTPEMKAKRAEALRLSKLAAKKRADAKAKSLAEARASEKALNASRQAAKMAYTNPIVPGEMVGFFAMPVTQILSGNIPTNAAVKEEVQEEPKIDEGSKLSPEEIEAQRIEAMKQARAKALADSKAAAREKVIARRNSLGRGKTPDGPERRKSQSVAANNSQKEQNPSSEPETLTETISPEPVKEIERVPLSPEDAAKVAEEASYATVDAAWGQSKAAEGSDFAALAREAAKEAGKSTVALGEIVEYLLSLSDLSEDDHTYLETKNSRAAEQMQIAIESANAASKAGNDSINSAKGELVDRKFPSPLIFNNFFL